MLEEVTRRAKEVTTEILINVTIAHKAKSNVQITTKIIDVNEEKMMNHQNAPAPVKDNIFNKEAILDLTKETTITTSRTIKIDLIILQHDSHQEVEEEVAALGRNATVNLLKMECICRVYLNL